MDPALAKHRHHEDRKGGNRMHDMTENLFEFLPFLRSHLRNLYYMLILLIVMECLASMSWGM